MTTVLLVLTLCAIQTIALHNIPGDPGVDYPVYFRAPRTSFLCRREGYFADVEAGCQAFHVCQRDGRMSTFLCPNGTIFHQAYSVCVWWYETECSSPASDPPTEDSAQRSFSYGVRTNSVEEFSSERSQAKEEVSSDVRRSGNVRQNFLEDLNNDDYVDDEPGEIMIAQSRKHIPPYKLQQYYFHSIAERHHNRNSRRRAPKSASARRKRTKYSTFR